LDIDDNVTVVDMLYRHFYSGSDRKSTEEETSFMRKLFSSETYVKNEYR